MWVVLHLLVFEQVRDHPRPPPAPAQQSRELWVPGLSLALESFPLSHHGLFGHCLVPVRANPEELLVSDLPELSKEGEKS